MKTLVLAGVWPHVRGATEAACVVAHELISYLTRHHEVDFACINFDRVTLPPGGERDRHSLEQAGVRFLPQILLEQRVPSSGYAGTAVNLLRADPSRLVRGAANAGDLAAALEDSSPDVVLTIWSEIATAAIARESLPKVAYYGNPDHKVLDARMRLNRRGGVAGISDSIRRFGHVSALRRAHISLMRRFDMVAEVAANDADFYKQRGVRSTYVPMVWPGILQEDWETIRDDKEAAAAIKITANVGNMSATGNTYGLLTLASQVLPELDRVLEKDFELHLFGGRQPNPKVAQLLSRDPRLIVRGFVDDLDSEILSSPIFLVANNYTRFKVAHTRILHAWSLGACVITFGDVKESMPELRHGYNALLASSPREMAELVAEAASDRGLRRELGRGGVTTLTNDYGRESVGAAVTGLLETAAGVR